MKKKQRNVSGGGQSELLRLERETGLKREAFGFLISRPMNACDQAIIQIFLDATE